MAPTAAERNDAVCRESARSQAKADLLDLARQCLALAAEAKHEAP